MKKLRTLSPAQLSTIRGGGILSVFQQSSDALLHKAKTSDKAQKAVMDYIRG